jgi:hypothetical protein
MIIVILKLVIVFLVGMIAGSLVMDFRLVYLYKKSTGKDLFDEIKNKEEKK